MSTLILNPSTLERIHAIAAYAAKAENWYLLGGLSKIPGSNPEHELVSGDVRAVFSWTQTPQGEAVYRHLTVSVLGSQDMPHPVVVYTLAHHFGFSGAELSPQGVVETPGDDWYFGREPVDNCVAVCQRVGP